MVQIFSPEAVDESYVLEDELLVVALGAWAWHYVVVDDAFVDVDAGVVDAQHGEFVIEAEILQELKV